MKVWHVGVILAALLGLALYAHISTCGWKALFVECRISEMTGTK